MVVLSGARCFGGALWGLPMHTRQNTNSKHRSKSGMHGCIVGEILC